MPGRQLHEQHNRNHHTHTRIAVFIDFDNIEIGVKSTIGGQFDIGLVLEAIKERGEVVTKIAYSDWKRAGDYSRILTQHAIRMVQRNFTPGGDKNGADITWRSTRSRWRSRTTTSTPSSSSAATATSSRWSRSSSSTAQGHRRRRPPVHQPDDAEELSRVHRLRESRQQSRRPQAARGGKPGQRLTADISRRCRSSSAR